MTLLWVDLGKIADLSVNHKESISEVSPAGKVDPNCVMKADTDQFEMQPRKGSTILECVVVNGSESEFRLVRVMIESRPGQCSCCQGP